MRRDFDIFPEDLEFLENSGFQWEAIKDRNQLWIVIYDYPLPKGYNQKLINVAVNIPSGYPRAQIDMVYFYPAISREDGKPIGALTNRAIDGKNWQRWSRHRTHENPWREGIDNIATHLALVEFWLIREFKLRPHAISV